MSISSIVKLGFGLGAKLITFGFSIGEFFTVSENIEGSYNTNVSASGSFSDEISLNASYDNEVTIYGDLQ